MLQILSEPNLNLTNLIETTTLVAEVAQTTFWVFSIDNLAQMFNLVISIDNLVQTTLVISIDKLAQEMLKFHLFLPLLIPIKDPLLILISVSSTKVGED